MAEDKKPDCVLSDGREVFIDLTKVTIAEWRTMFDKDSTTEEGDAILAKCAGLKDVGKLNVMDYKRVAAAMFKRFREPLADPT